MKSNDKTIRESKTYFLPRAEWTLCSPDLRLFNCYGFLSSDISKGITKDSKRTWWIVLQHCIVPKDKSATYEMGVFSEPFIEHGGKNAPHYNGTAQLSRVQTIKSGLLDNNNQSYMSPPCLIEGSVDTMKTADSWFHTLATMSIPADSSISYRFLFRESEPSNTAHFDVLFYSDKDLKVQKPSELSQC